MNTTSFPCFVYWVCFKWHSGENPIESLNRSTRLLSSLVGMRSMIARIAQVGKKGVGIYLWSFLMFMQYILKHQYECLLEFESLWLHKRLGTQNHQILQKIEWSLFHALSRLVWFSVYAPLLLYTIHNEWAIRLWWAQARTDMTWRQP